MGHTEIDNSNGYLRAETSPMVGCRMPVFVVNPTPRPFLTPCSASIREIGAEQGGGKSKLPEEVWSVVCIPFHPLAGPLPSIWTDLVIG